MKNLLLLNVFSMLFFINVMVAQDIDVNSYTFVPNVSEAEKTMAQGAKNAFTIRIRGNKKKTITKAWGKVVKGYGAKSKYNKKTKEYFADNAKISSISENTIDIYTTFNTVGEETEMTVWFDLGGAFLSSYNFAEQTKVAEKIIKDFEVDMEKRRISDYLKKQEDLLGGQRKDLEKLGKDQTKMTNEITDWEKRIEENKKKIEENKTNQENTKTLINTQEELINKIKNLISQIGQ